MASSLLNARPTPEAPTCRPWCAEHDPEPDICFSTTTHLDFGPAAHLTAIHHLDACLASDDESGPSILVGINHGQAAEFTADSAEQTARLLLDLAAQARTGVTR